MSANHHPIFIWLSDPSRISNYFQPLGLDEALLAIVRTALKPEYGPFSGPPPTLHFVVKFPDF
jgi:hypothetical protein